jgi:histone H3/H4
MPPKGWRKNADGQYPQPNKDSELVSIDDILFPRSTIQKLAKSILEGENGGNLIVAKDSVLAMQRSATVFVSHLLFYARQLSKADSRKVVSAQDIFNALEQTDFSGFLPEVKQKLAVFEANSAAKKIQKVNKIPVSSNRLLRSCFSASVTGFSISVFESSLLNMAVTSSLGVSSSVCLVNCLFLARFKAPCLASIPVRAFSLNLFLYLPIFVLWYICINLCGSLIFLRWRRDLLNKSRVYLFWYTKIIEGI